MGTVLLVDDDEEIRHVLRMTLEDEGYTIREATDGLTALDLLRRSDQPMVVLLDLMMPRLSGAGVLGVVAAEPLLAERHSFLLMTAMGRLLPRPLIMLLGALNTPVLPKPLDLDVLLHAVVRAELRLQQRRQMSQDVQRETTRKQAGASDYDGLEGRPRLVSRWRDTQHLIH